MSNDNTVTVLPDGSAFATASFPLPADHWLYAPRGEWDNERDDFAETPRPILTHAQRDAVVAAVRYAIRGATMCGKEPDFDPDALVQNAVYALCGPFGKTAVAAPAPQPELVGYLPAYELDRVRSGHDGRLRSAKFGPSELDGDIPVYAGIQSPSAGDAPTPWRSPETAPKDGSLLRLLVAFTEHPMDDDTGPPQATIGMNNLGNTGVDEWQFAGWCWTHDRFTQGEGTVVGWLPLLGESQAPSVAREKPADVLLRVIQRLNGNPYSLTKSECISEVEAMYQQALAAPEGQG